MPMPKHSLLLNELFLHCAKQRQSLQHMLKTLAETKGTVASALLKNEVAASGALNMRLAERISVNDGRVDGIRWCPEPREYLWQYWTFPRYAGLAVHQDGCYRILYMEFGFDGGTYSKKDFDFKDQLKGAWWCLFKKPVCVVNNHSFFKSDLTRQDINGEFYNAKTFYGVQRFQLKK